MLKVIPILITIMFSTNALSYDKACIEKWFGKPSYDSFYIGLWTLHLYDYKNINIYNNSLYLLAYKGFCAGTFMNCYGDRTYMLGVQRYFIDKPLGPFCTMLGYRAGFLYGYNEQLFPLAGKLKILPCCQIIYDLSWRNLGIELSYTGIIISAGFFIRFN